MGVQIDLLGELAVYATGRRLDVGHARQQCVLAALAVDADRPVPVDEVVARVWGDRPPQRTRNTLAGYVSRLRRATAAADGIAISRCADAYRLTVDPMAVDLRRFDALVARARGVDDAGTALALFDQALLLWRGEPMRSLDTPWVNEVRAALNAQRLAVVLDRTDVALALGRHAAVVAELDRLTTAHPFHERLAGQLMLALYRCGRQADALLYYDRFRRALADDLGADPGPSLRRLHRGILGGDAALAPPGSDRRPVPRQLPPALPTFVGRSRELDLLDAIRAAAGRRPATVVITTLSGAAGVGKTTLAVHWAHRVAGDFPDGQLYVNLRGFDPGGRAVTPAEAVHRLLDALASPGGYRPADPAARFDLYRSLIAGKRMLVVLDNAATVEQVRPLLPGTSGCLVVVTSRRALTGLVTAEGARPIRLDLLTVEEARALLTVRLGRRLVAAEPAATDDIVDACDRLPLALAVVAARAVENPRLSLPALAAQLREARLGTLSGEDPYTDLRAVFSWSYDALSGDAARLFRLCGRSPGPGLGVAATAALADMPPDRVRPLLVELTRANLLVEAASSRYTCHDLLRHYADDLLHRNDGASGRAAADLRLLDHYTHAAIAAQRLLHPTRQAGPLGLDPPGPTPTPYRPDGRERAKQWFVDEHAALLDLAERAVAGGADRHCWQLAWALEPYLESGGHWPDWSAVWTGALTAARRLGDSGAQAYALYALAVADVRLGHEGRALGRLHEAVTLARRSSSVSVQSNAHSTIGQVYERQGRYRSALVHARHAVALHRAAGHERGLARSLNNIGWLYARLGRHWRARAICTESLGRLQRLGDGVGTASAWNSLGYVHRNLGHHARARTCYERALRLYRDLRDRYGEAATLDALASTLRVAGDLRTARATWEAALAVFTDLGHPGRAAVTARLAAGGIADAGPVSRRCRTGRPVRAGLPSAVRRLLVPGAGTAGTMMVNVGPHVG